MTNQEAISVLESINAKTDYFLINDDARAEAFDMAISALEAQDAPDTNVDTSKYTVSATAVEEMLKDLLPERGMWEIEGDEAKNAICETVHDALEGLWKLSSAQPERCSDCIVHGGDWECDHMHCRKGRLPSAQPDLTAEDWKLIKQLRSYHNGSYARVLDRLIAAASQPAIIHCRDCKHYYFADNRIPQEQTCVCDLDGDRWSPDSFCSFGERKK